MEQYHGGESYGRVCTVEPFGSSNVILGKVVFILLNYMTVKIYSTPTCVYCRMLKDFLKQNNVAFEELDVQNDLKAREEMFQKSKQMGVPVSDVDGQIFVGFDRAGISKALGL